MNDSGSVSLGPLGITVALALRVLTLRALTLRALTLRASKGLRAVNGAAVVLSVDRDRGRGRGQSNWFLCPRTVQEVGQALCLGWDRAKDSGLVARIRLFISVCVRSSWEEKADKDFADEAFAAFNFHRSIAALGGGLSFTAILHVLNIELTTRVLVVMLLILSAQPLACRLQYLALSFSGWHAVFLF